MLDAKFCMKFLRKYGYKTTEQGVQKILDTWKVNKNWEER